MKECKHKMGVAESLSIIAKHGAWRQTNAIPLVGHHRRVVSVFLRKSVLQRKSQAQ